MTREAYHNQLTNLSEPVTIFKRKASPKKKMDAVDITRHYFNSLNCKKLTSYKDESFSNFNKANFTNSRNKTTKMIYFDDSGYISPITPFHSEEGGHKDIEIQDVSIKVLSNHGNDVHPNETTVKDWVEPEEEDVAGKMQLRNGHLMCKNNGAKFELNRWKFCKKLAEQFDGVNIIGKRIGRQNCNIISKLHKRNVSDFLNRLMFYISPEDVNNMCLVSKNWLECCKTSHAAQQKLKALKKSMKIKCCLKENIIKVQPEKRKPKPKRMTKSELFKECANTLKKDECLQKCPKCEHPAKVRPVQERGICMNSWCGYQYCSKCRSKYHGSDICFQVGTKRLTKEVVNIRAAKKYLKRL